LGILFLLQKNKNFGMLNCFFYWSNHCCVPFLREFVDLRNPSQPLLPQSLSSPLIAFLVGTGALVVAPEAFAQAALPAGEFQSGQPAATSVVTAPSNNPSRPLDLGPARVTLPQSPPTGGVAVPIPPIPTPTNESPANTSLRLVPFQAVSGAGAGNPETRTCNTSRTRAQLVMDADTGEIIVGQNIDRMANWASVSKLVTATLVLRDIRAGRMALTDHVDNLLMETLVRSNNAASDSLGIMLGGSISGYATLANNFMREIGLYSVRIYNPSGLPIRREGEGNCGTTRDLARLIVYIWNNYPEISRYTLLESIPFTERFSTNRLLPVTSNPRAIPVQGIGEVAKTGTTAVGGENFATTWRVNGRRLIVITMGNAEGQRFPSAISLMEYTAQQNRFQIQYASIRPREVPANGLPARMVFASQTTMAVGEALTRQGDNPSQSDNPTEATSAPSSAPTPESATSQGITTQPNALAPIVAPQ
jgi:D-alanyl-D-alanine carboxypeptidase